MRTKILLSAAVAASLTAIAPAAVASSPDAVPPTVKALRPLGLTVSWPVSGAEVEGVAGTRLVVTIGQTVRRGGKRRAIKRTAARVSLVRLPNADGTGGRTVSSTLLRRGAGRVEVTLPEGDGVSYELRLKAGGRLFASRVKVPNPNSSCPAGSGTMTVQLVSPTTVGRDEWFGYEVKNTTTGCVGHTYGPSVYRLVDGAWQRLDFGRTGYIQVVRYLRPGQSSTYGFRLRAEDPDGVYRVESEFHRFGGTGVPGIGEPPVFTVGNPMAGQG